MTNRERFKDACLAMDELEKVSRLLQKAKAPRYLIDRIEGMECILVDFCSDIDDLILEDDLNG